MLFTPIILLLWAASIVPGIFAIPMTYEFDDPKAEEGDNKKHFEDAMPEVNRQIDAMEKNLLDAKGGRSKEFLQAFGPKADVAQVIANVAALKKGNFVIEDAKTSKDVNMAGVPKGAAWMGPAKFGLGFHNPPSDVKDPNAMRAGTIIHEATHQLAHTGDRVVEGTNAIIKPYDHQDVHDKASTKITGYAATIEKITSENDLGDNYKSLRDSSPNMHDNADSYRVFANLCSKSLYRRALLEDDAIEFYLARRQSCTLPPDYFAKKAAAKAAATGTNAPKDKSLKSANSVGVKGTKAVATPVKGAKGKVATGAAKRLKTSVGSKAAGTQKLSPTAASRNAMGSKGATKKLLPTTRKSIGPKSKSALASGKPTRAAASRRVLSSKAGTAAKKLSPTAATRKAAGLKGATTRKSSPAAAAASRKATAKTPTRLASGKPTTKAGGPLGATAKKSSPVAVASRKAVKGTAKKSPAASRMAAGLAKKPSLAAAGTAAKKSTLKAATATLKTAAPAAKKLYLTAAGPGVVAGAVKKSAPAAAGRAAMAKVAKKP